MTPKETAALLSLIATLDGRIRRAMTDAHVAARTIDEWTEATAHIPAVTNDGAWDAAHCVRQYYEQQRGDHSARYFAFEPHHLIAAWAQFRGARMERHTDPLPAADPDDVDAYLAELLATRQAVAAGQAPPVEYRQALNRAGQRRLTALAGSIGQPLHDDGVSRQPELLRAMRSHLPDTRAALPELALPCPVATCRAGARRLCKSPNGRELRQAVHGQRRDAWAVHTVMCPECDAQREQPCTTREPHPARIRAALSRQKGISAA